MQGRRSAIADLSIQPATFQWVIVVSILLPINPIYPMGYSSFHFIVHYPNTSHYSSFHFMFHYPKAGYGMQTFNHLSWVLRLTALCLFWASRHLPKSSQVPLYHFLEAQVISSEIAYLGFFSPSRMHFFPFSEVQGSLWNYPILQGDALNPIPKILNHKSSREEERLV